MLSTIVRGQAMLSLVLLASGLVGCRGESAAGSGATGSSGHEVHPAPQPKPTVLRTETSTALFSHRTPEGGWLTVQSMAEVPEAARAEVQVVDLSRSPLERGAEHWVELADLRTPGKDGTYPVRLVRRDQWEARLREGSSVPGAATGEPQHTIGAGPGGPPSPTPVSSSAADEHRLIMYSTQGCPVCVQARRFLAALKIPFVERDVQQDPAAAQELQRKARQAGVAAGGVPVFEYRGRLLPGFDRDRLLGLVQGKSN